MKNILKLLCTSMVMAILISAGGTSTLVALIGIGIAQAIIAKYNREKKQEAIEKSL